MVSLSCLPGQRVNNKKNLGLELGLSMEKVVILFKKSVSFDLDHLVCFVRTVKTGKTWTQN